MSQSEAIRAVTELLECLEDLQYRLENVESLESYGVAESLVEYIGTILSRFEE